MFPNDLAVLVGSDVVQWAAPHTPFALDAILGGVEIFVGDEESVEEGTQQVGLHPCTLASHYLCLCLTFFDAFGNVG